MCGANLRMSHIYVHIYLWYNLKKGFEKKFFGLPGEPHQQCLMVHPPN